MCVFQPCILPPHLSKREFSIHLDDFVRDCHSLHDRCYIDYYLPVVSFPGSGVLDKALITQHAYPQVLVSQFTWPLHQSRARSLCNRVNNYPPRLRCCGISELHVPLTAYSKQLIEQPVPLLWRLRTSTRQKAILTGTFLTAGLYAQSPKRMT